MALLLAQPQPEPQTVVIFKSEEGMLVALGQVAYLNSLGLQHEESVETYLQSISHRGNQERSRSVRVLHHLVEKQFNHLTFSPTEISYSHSGHLAALFLWPGHQVGIDVELIREKASRLAPKFLFESEQALFSHERPVVASWLFGAKEAAYKALRHPGLSVRNHLSLTGQLDENGSASGRVECYEMNPPTQVAFQSIRLGESAWVTWAHVVQSNE